MVAAIGQSALIAVGLLLAALPMVLITFVLATKRPPKVSRAFFGGWMLGLAVVGSLVITVAALVVLAGPSPCRLSVVKIALGVLLLVLAVRKWPARTRFRSGDVPEAAKRMAFVDSVIAGKAFGLAFLLAAANPADQEQRGRPVGGSARAGRGVDQQRRDRRQGNGVTGF